ncbi:MAG: hypothetical protein R6V85_08750, partial [Polyangia bacterium]
MVFFDRDRRRHGAAREVSAFGLVVCLAGALAISCTYKNEAYEDGEELCCNGKDDDGDGLVDCEEQECQDESCCQDAGTDADADADADSDTDGDTDTDSDTDADTDADTDTDTDTDADTDTDTDTLVPNGGACDGDEDCLSGHCDNEICCDEGTCCVSTDQDQCQPYVCDT